MKLTQQQKEIIMNKYARLGHLVIMRVEKIKLEMTFDEAIDFAYDIIREQAE
jgi:hypothetical protein